MASVQSVKLRSSYLRRCILLSLKRRAGLLILAFTAVLIAGLAFGVSAPDDVIAAVISLFLIAAVFAVQSYQRHSLTYTSPVQLP